MSAYTRAEERMIGDIVQHLHNHCAKHDRKAISAIGRRVAHDLFAAAKTVDSGHGPCVINEIAVVLDVCAALMTHCGEVMFDAAIEQRNQALKNSAFAVLPPPIPAEHIELPLSAVLQFVGERFAEMGANAVGLRVDAERAGVPHTVQ